MCELVSSPKLRNCALDVVSHGELLLSKGGNLAMILTMGRVSWSLCTGVDGLVGLLGVLGGWTRCGWGCLVDQAWVGLLDTPGMGWGCWVDRVWVELLGAPGTGGAA